MSGLANWLHTYEYIAIWLEGIALVLILLLDWWEYRKQGSERTKEERERVKQHEETAAQLAASLRQIEASQELAEAAHKPCLVFSTSPREPIDAILAADLVGHDGAMIIRCPEAQAQLENIGSGPAINAHYRLTPTDASSTVARLRGYLITVLAGDKFLTAIPRGILQGNEWEIVLSYESLSGRKYETK